jgi:hypothetical protein
VRAYAPAMPSQPLSKERSAVVKLVTRLDVEAMALAKERTEMPPAVARLALLVPPSRTDLVDEVLVTVGRRSPHGFDWPPIALVHELIHRVGRVHRGEVKLRGPNGEVVEVIDYTDKTWNRRQVYRLHRHGVFIGEYKDAGGAGQGGRPGRAGRGRTTRECRRLATQDRRLLECPRLPGSTVGISWR